MFRESSYVLCFALTLVCLGTTTAEETVAQKAPTAIATIDDAIQKFVDEGQISGAVTLVGRNGKIVHLGAVGMSDIESRKEMKPFSLFSIASMTKPITATAIMILQDQGKLSVDDSKSEDGQQRRLRYP